MFCKKCRTELVKDSRTCNYCGEKIGWLDRRKQRLIESDSKSPYLENESNNRLFKLANSDFTIKKIDEHDSKVNSKFRQNSKKIILGVSSLLILSILVGIAFGINSLNSKYKLGMAYMDNYQYEEAIELFKSLQG